MKQRFYSTQFPYKCAGFEVIREKVTKSNNFYISKFVFFFAL